MRLSPFRINPMQGFITDQLARIKRAAPRKLFLMSPAIAMTAFVAGFCRWAEHEKRKAHYW
jgi:hypothetical protein